MRNGAILVPTAIQIDSAYFQTSFIKSRQKTEFLVLRGSLKTLKGFPHLPVWRGTFIVHPQHGNFET